MNRKLIKYYIHTFMVKHKVLLIIHKHLRNLFVYGYAFEIERRAKLSFFDYSSLAKPLNKPWMDFVPDNNKYGMNFILKEYMGVSVNKSLNGIVEHGLYLGDYIDRDELLLNVKTIVTFGDSRIKHLMAKTVNKVIVPIGPYIHYAKSLLDEQSFVKLKRNLGKVLLVFPCHSLAGGQWCEYSMKELCTEIKRVGQNYDSILISLYYTDIGKADIYRQNGFEVVTSGHENDKYFLSRQRTLIELSDYTMSNSIGTHIGYCIYLNKPHYVYTQETRHVNVFSRKMEIKQSRGSIVDSEVQEIQSAFSENSNSILAMQRELVDKYWGVKYIKTPEELKNELDFYEY